MGWRNQSILDGRPGMHAVPVAAAVPLAAAAAGAKSRQSAMERGGYHAAFAEHLPGTLRRVHHTAEPPAGVSANPESGKVWEGGFGKLGGETGESPGR